MDQIKILNWKIAEDQYKYVPKEDKNKKITQPKFSFPSIKKVSVSGEVVKKPPIKRNRTPQVKTSQIVNYKTEKSYIENDVTVPKLFFRYELDDVKKVYEDFQSPRFNKSPRTNRSKSPSVHTKTANTSKYSTYKTDVLTDMSYISERSENSKDVSRKQFDKSSQNESVSKTETPRIEYRSEAKNAVNLIKRFDNICNKHKSPRVAEYTQPVKYNQEIDILLNGKITKEVNPIKYSKKINSVDVDYNKRLFEKAKLNKTVDLDEFKGNFEYSSTDYLYKNKIYLESLKYSVKNKNNKSKKINEIQVERKKRFSYFKEKGIYSEEYKVSNIDLEYNKLRYSSNLYYKNLFCENGNIHRTKIVTEPNLVIRMKKIEKKYMKSEESDYIRSPSKNNIQERSPDQ